NRTVGINRVHIIRFEDSINFCESHTFYADGVGGNYGLGKCGRGDGEDTRGQPPEARGGRFLPQGCSLPSLFTITEMRPAAGRMAPNPDALALEAQGNPPQTFLN